MEHSLAQLRLLAAAAEREAASRALMDCQVMASAVAASMVKEGAAAFRQLQNRLIEQLKKG